MSSLAKQRIKIANDIQRIIEAAFKKAASEHGRALTPELIAPFLYRARQLIAQTFPLVKLHSYTFERSLMTVMDKAKIPGRIQGHITQEYKSYRSQKPSSFK